MAERRQQPARPSAPSAADGWLLLVYKVPSEPSRARVAVWRDLKRMGALYLQQAVCILPRRDDLPQRLEAVRDKIAELEGSCFWFALDGLDPDVEVRLVEGFRDQAGKEYAGIGESCRHHVVGEIERARAEGSVTFERSEAIRGALDKLRRCLGKIEARDWFGGLGRDDARLALEQAAMRLAEFEAEVADTATATATATHHSST